MTSICGWLSPMDIASPSQMAQRTGQLRRSAAGGSSSGILSKASSSLNWLVLLSVLQLPAVAADCWLIEGEKGFVWLAICSMNQPPFEAIPTHMNSTIVDLRLNENKIRSVHYSSLSRFGNLTYLNLTKNDISYVEDGAFSAQFNLQVLQMGFNKLRNLTEGMMRGLGKLQYLYLQANLIETVAHNAFWECLNLENIDLSMNRIQVLDGNLFSGLSKLTTCELYTNPFSCSCELLDFLRWLSSFPNRTSERMVCDSPKGLSGYNLLSQNPRMPTQRNALYALNVACTDDGNSVTNVYVVDLTTQLPDFASPCGLDDCSSGTPPDEVISLSPIFPEARPIMTLKQVQHSSAVVTVQIPHPYKKMYILMLYNNSFFTDIQNLRNQREDIELKNLKPNTDYTYCVASIRNSLRFNHTCLTISTGRRAGAETVTNPSSATHYIMTILGCLFGMLLFLGLLVHCLRKRRIMEEKERKMSRIQRTLIELKYGGEGDIEGGSGGSVSQKLAAGDSLSRMPYLPQGSEIDPYKLQEVIETPGHKSAKLNYMEVRSSGIEKEREREREREMSPQANPQGSVAEISTIAKEVDKVNQIINNCIDALKSESTSFQQGMKSPSSVSGGAVSNEEPQLVLLSEQGERGGEFLSPVYQGGRGGREERGRNYHHTLQRHHSMEAPPTSKRPSTSSSPGSARSPRSFRSEGGYHSSESRYIERNSPGERGGGGDAIRTVNPAAAILRAEAQRIRQYNEHRHSYPGSQQHLQELQHPPILQELHHHPGGRRPSVLDPLTLSRQAKQRELAYSQLSPHYPLSPQYHNLSYCSSPEEDEEEEEGLLCTPTLGLWERFKLHRKRHRQASLEDEGYVAAGHALRRKVQFAKDEDLHDILDYWKGVSAQHKA
ncbi:protein ELFN1 [Nothobranchius furzeri]|uniref:Extracellular leucine-rich repeat and fibronectin type III domain containing 1b n=3 Tax=Nothobranchius TaxID=28779 RepID=A0A1A8AMK8_NOTFU|nr:protein ELFN1 [Nothobranchius furzeri]KAF7223690.1 transcript variant X1 [Nothobranchius furzeri]